MADSATPYPYLDPSQAPAWLDVQRKQQMAQMLMGAFQQSNQTPENWNSMKVVPRKGALGTVATLATALMAGKANNAALDSQQQYMQGLMGGGQPIPQPSGPGAGIVSPDASPASQDAAQNVTAGNAPPGLVPQQAPQQNSMIPPGMPRGQANALVSMMGPAKYAEMFIAPNWKTPEIVASLTHAGINPNGPQGQAIQQAVLNKQATNLQEVRPGTTMYDVNKGAPVFTGPDQGINTTWNGTQPSMSSIPGALEAQREGAAAKTAGAQANMPIKLGTDENGKDIYGFATPPGPGRTPAATGAPNATAGGQTASPANIESQKKGAESGQSYASELSKNATGATEVRRSISELKNLSAQATPGAANEAKAKLGAFMIAAGADPENVARWTGVDTGALQAAQKQTATLAVNSIHSMTSRGTNFDLDTFMKNNPNMNMADPAAFARVADYMNNKAGQDIAKQKDFAQWKKISGVSPDDWETQHTAHWLEQQNQGINAGQSNSRVPGAPQHSLAELQAEARKRGLIK